MTLGAFGLMLVNTLLPRLPLWWLIVTQRASRLEWGAKVVMVVA